MSKSKYWISAGLFCLVTAVSVFGAENIYDVRDYGAKPDGKTLCTKPIQAAIDQCATRGGGTVYFPCGRWLSGTIYLKSYVTVSLDPCCVLLGSRDLKDYIHAISPDAEAALGGSYSGRSLIAGKNLKHIAIRGRGTIDGQGSAFRWKNGKERPKIIYLENCSDVLVEDVRMRNSGSWMQHYRNCDRLTVRGISVFNHSTYNNDGLNIDYCRDVCISGCMLDSDDDAMCLKSLSSKPCENVTITNCVFSSFCNAIKMGTESGGGFKNITITNCVICPPRYPKSIYGRQKGVTGIALEIVDGGILDRVAISNIVMNGVNVPIFIRLGNRARQYEKDLPRPPVGKLRNVILSNIIATDASRIGCSITGLPGHPIENVSLSNINLSFEGGEIRRVAAKKVQEKAESYPAGFMFGVLPAYGCYCRHVKGLKFTNVRLQTARADQRHALVCEDVEDMLIDSLDAPYSPGAAAIIRMTDVREIFVRGCRPKTGTEVFLNLQGPQSRDVVLLANDFSGVERVAVTDPDVPKAALAQLANHIAEKP